jgi:ABC-2 type transport system permease protein
MLRAEVLKWWSTIQISWSKSMAYKLNFFLLIIGPTVVFFFIKYNLWTAIYSTAGTAFIQGFDLRQMLAYQAWVMMVAFLAQGHNSMALAEDIRLGRISAYLVYPFDFWRFHAAEFLGFQALQTVIAAGTLLVLILSGLVQWPGFGALATGLLFSWLVSTLWFTCQFALGLMSFWLEESWTLRVMFSIITQFLSGAIIPLDLYPQWFVDLTSFLPFADMTYTPTRIFMGAFDGSVLAAALRICLWLGIAIGGTALIWRRGIRMYTGAGM